MEPGLMNERRQPQRQSPRLKGYDYSQSGAYFVTICAHNRAHLFGEIVAGGMMLNDYGQIAESCWAAIPDHYANVELDLYVIMPNHVHGIIVVVDSSTDGRDISRPYDAGNVADAIHGVRVRANGIRCRQTPNVGNNHRHVQGRRHPPNP